MKVAVLGAGLIGVASAYYLWRDGHEVEIIDQQAQPASVTSYANACLVSASRALPWPTPTAYKTLWRALTDRTAPMRISRAFDPALWRWGREFLSCANARDFERLSTAKLGFARFCQTALETTLAETGVDCGYRRDGLVYVCRTDATLAAAQARVALVARQGYDVRLLARDAVLALEPALASSNIVGGSFAVSDAQGDSRAFTRALAQWLAQRGVRLRVGETVTARLEQRGRTFALSSAGQDITADAYVVALGPATTAFAQRLGRRVPIYPVKGFSMTVPVQDVQRAPQRGGICEDSLIAYCPLQSDAGPTMRITTGAVFCGDDMSFVDADFTAHRAHFDALFPGALDWSAASVERWACQRPMTPSSLPIIQRDTQFDRLYWNCGQGHIGWTMSCGSGRIVAELIGGKTPGFDLSEMKQL